MIGRLGPAGRGRVSAWDSGQWDVDRREGSQCTSGCAHEFIPSWDFNRSIFLPSYHRRKGFQSEKNLEERAGLVQGVERRGTEYFGTEGEIVAFTPHLVSCAAVDCT